MTRRQIKLGVFLTGWGSPAAWRDPTIPADARTNLDFIKRVGITAEEAKLDFAFIADSAYISASSPPQFLSRAEPTTALSAVAAVTSRIGLVGTMSTSYSEPFTTARQLASLDVLSGGRAGWNAVTSAIDDVAKNLGHDRLHDHALRYRIAEEYIDVVAGLWDSWEPGAFVRDRQAGLYADLSRMHTLNHKGEFFSVKGPLNVEPSPQGRPILFQAGSSPAGKALAARTADAIFAGQAENEYDSASYYAEIKQLAEAHGRDPSNILILPSIVPVVADTQAEADAIYERASSYIDIAVAVKFLSRYFSFFDFSQFPLDEVLPDLGDIGANSFRSTAEHFKRIAREERLTLRQFALRASNPKGPFVGTPEKVAQLMAEQFEKGWADGFILQFQLQPQGLEDFASKVVPILQDWGLFRRDYEASTLRGHLGLPDHVNRYAGTPRPQGAAAD
jgi:FMN-dependent oxidoreductase (nitrilotriacetate monooxygenase family)